MSDTVEQYYRYRKFCKVIGLHNVFNDPIDNFYNTTELNGTKTNEFSSKLPNPELPITKDTILFIIADSVDKNKKIKISTIEFNENDDNLKHTRTLSEFDTMLWVNGNIYSLSQKNVKSVSYNNDTNKLDIIYSDDDKESIDITELQLSRKIAVNFPLYKSEEQGTDDNENEETYDYIQFFGQVKNDSGRNFVIGMYDDEENIPDEDKNTHTNLTYTTIIGKGNIASKNRQIILGDFNKVDNSKFIVCNGKSNNERENLFTISDSGRVFAMDDFVLSQKTGEHTHKLSDIHSVTIDDWYKEPKNN